MPQAKTRISEMLYMYGWVVVYHDPFNNKHICNNKSCTFTEKVPSLLRLPIEPRLALV